MNAQTDQSMKSSVFSGRSKAPVLHQSQSHSPQAEQAIIGAFLDSPGETYDKVVGKLQAEYFMEPLCKLAFEKMTALVADGNEPDLVMLAAAMDGYVTMDVPEIEEELTLIYERFPSSKNVVGWVNIVQDKFIQRQIEKTGDRLMDLAHAQDFGPEEKIAEANKMLIEASSALSNDNVSTAEEMVMHTLAQIQARTESGGDVAGQSFGFPELDDATTGMHPAEFIVVAGRPGMGKTAFAMAIAEACSAHRDPARRKRLLMFSLEMSHEQMGMRWLSTLYEVPSHAMRSGNVTPEQWERLNEGLAEAAQLPFMIDKNASVNVDQICSTARKTHRENPGGLGMVVVDYLQLITTSTRNNANRAELVGEISRALKNLSRELKIPVVALSQLNRSVEQRQDKRPMMSDLRESGSIEQDADVIIFLYRDEYYTKDACKEPGIAEIILAKQRNGEPQTVKLGWNGPLTKFRSLRRPMSTSESVNAAYEGKIVHDRPF
jgi:replicative DNA helicase